MSGTIQPNNLPRHEYPSNVLAAHQEKAQQAYPVLPQRSPQVNPLSLTDRAIKPLVVVAEMTNLLTLSRQMRNAYLCNAASCIFALLMIPGIIGFCLNYHVVSSASLTISSGVATLIFMSCSSSTSPSELLEVPLRKFINDCLDEGNLDKIKWLLEKGFSIDEGELCKSTCEKVIEAIKSNQQDKVRARLEIMEFLAARHLLVTNLYYIPESDLHLVLYYAVRFEQFLVAHAFESSRLLSQPFDPKILIEMAELFKKRGVYINDNKFKYYLMVCSPIFGKDFYSLVARNKDLSVMLFHLLISPSEIYTLDQNDQQRFIAEVKDNIYSQDFIILALRDAYNKANEAFHRNKTDELRFRLEQMKMLATISPTQFATTLTLEEKNIFQSMKTHINFS